MSAPNPFATLSLAGPSGEPVDLRRLIVSHGVADLPPMWRDPSGSAFEITLALPGNRARTVRVGLVAGLAAGSRVAPGDSAAEVSVQGRAPAARDWAVLATGIRHVLRLDEDLSGFYALAAEDSDLAWVATGAGRLARCPTVFEEVVKTLATTNCSWSATERMVGTIVRHLGTEASDGRRSFPSPAAMAEAGEAFYRDVVRAGYRSKFFWTIARDVAEGRLDLEALDGGVDLPDDEVERRLLALPGIGPYAAAHTMMMLGRYSRLILDSWTRPTYARLAGRASVSDAAIARRFRRYGPWAGLAFWCVLTRGWIPDDPVAAGRDGGAATGAR